MRDTNNKVLAFKIFYDEDTKRFDLESYYYGKPGNNDFMPETVCEEASCDDLTRKELKQNLKHLIKYTK